jgi:hypothetical protein
MQLVHAILELLAVQRPLIAASNDFAYGYYPPYQWSQSGTVGLWRYTKTSETGYRFERPEGVVVDIARILEYAADAVSARTLGMYLASKEVHTVTLDDVTIDVADTAALDRALAQLVTSGLLSPYAEGVYRVVRHDLSQAVALAQQMATEHFGTTLDAIAIEAVFRELLWGPRKTWRCFVDGLLTRHEAANLLVAHLDSRSIRREPPPDLSWRIVSGRLCVELWRVFPPSGPAALSIELVVLPVSETQRLAVRTYDPELDNVGSILHDVCDHLHEHHLAELTYRIGDVYEGADVRVALCVVLEQLPAAITAIAEHRDFEIDNYEQGFETKLAFAWRGEDYAMTISRHWTELPDPLAITADEVLGVLVHLRASFMTALRRVAPELEQHPWIQAWLGVRA